MSNFIDLWSILYFGNQFNVITWKKENYKYFDLRKYFAIIMIEIPHRLKKRWTTASSNKERKKNGNIEEKKERKIER